VPKRVHVRFTKYDGSLHWHFDTIELGRDEYGWWLGARKDTEARRGAEPITPIVNDVVMLVPKLTTAAGLFFASFNTEHEAEVYCDLTTVPECSDDLVTMVDMDLDVVRRRSDGTVFLDDEDEFVEHQAKFGYPTDLIDATSKAAAELMELVSARAEPFGTACNEWVDALRDLS